MARGSGLGWSFLGQGSVAACCESDYQPYVSMNGRNFLYCRVSYSRLCCMDLGFTFFDVILRDVILPNFLNHLHLQYLEGWHLLEAMLFLSRFPPFHVFMPCTRNSE
jgi:hypothetical protein